MLLRAVLACGVLVASASVSAARPERLSRIDRSAFGGPRSAAEGRRGVSIGRASGVWLTDGVDVPGGVADGAIAERAVRSYLAMHLRTLAPGARLDDFELVANHVDGRLRTITFRQRWRGLRVLGGGLGFVIGNDRIFAIRASAQPHVDAVMSMKPTTRERAVLRVGSRYEVVEIVDTHGANGERWDVYVDARGAELGRTSRVLFASGRLEYNAGVRHAGSTRADVGAANAAITANGVSTTTQPDGDFTWAGTAPATVIATTAGTYVNVNNAAGSDVTTTLSVQPGGTSVWNLASDELGDAQVSAYVYANIAKARARVINPAIASWLDAALAVSVNETGSCNARSTGDSVHFYRASAMCENSARVGDVVMHEIGHSLHNQSIISGMGAFEEHLSEGLADFFAASITGDTAVGRGFFKTDEPLREIDPVGSERVYPVDFDFDPHVSGLIIAGALWDLRKELIESLGLAAGIARTDLIFTGIMQRADDIGATYDAARIADDDDGNLANGTPNACALESAFGRHGLVPGYVTTTVDPPVIDGLALSVRVSTPTGATCAPRTVTGMKLTWKANDGVASEIQLAPGDGVTWTASFPEQPDGTVLTYSIDVSFDDGSVTSFPNNAADPQYQLFVGAATEIWCERFDTDPEWAQTSNFGFAWQVGPVVPDPTSPDPDVAYSAPNVLGTDLDADGRYRANLISTITTPVIDTSAFELVHLQYRRWLTVEDAMFDQAALVVNGTELWRNASASAGTLDHVDREWRFVNFDLTPWVATGSAEVQFKLATDFGKELGGWTLDDVCIVGIAKIPHCGDAVLDPGEQCDDGNNLSDDGCTALCIDEVTAGGGGCCSASRDARGSLLLGLGVVLLLRRRRAQLRDARL